MKKLLVLTILLLGCLCIAQDSEADFPAAARIFFSDGTDIQLSCTQDGLCRVMRSTAPSVVTRVNLGFSTKHGYTLLVK
ncbi:MAG: hypothetical protein ABSH02_05425 [Candidatus Sulfotelmatobacter sp.]|jgi:hypothetical protein